MILATLQAAAISSHDRLDASMFWVGLLFVATPLLIIGSVVGFLVWKKRKADHDAAVPGDHPN